MTATVYTVRKTAEVKAADGEILLPVQKPEGGKGKSGLCIKVPAVSDAVLQVIYNSPIGQEAFKDCVDSYRSHIASMIHKQGGIIGSDRIGVDGILAAMKAANENQRMTREAIGNWFDADLAPLLETAIKNKLPAISDDKLDKVVSSYRNDFISLASRNIIMGEEMKNKLLKAIALLPDEYESVIGEKVAVALSESAVDLGDVL